MWGQPRRDPGLQRPPETGDSEASGWEAMDGNTQEETSAGPPAHRMRMAGATGRPESPGRGRAGAALPKAPVVLGGQGVRWGGQGGGCLHVWGLGGMCLREVGPGRATATSRAGLECPP